MIEFTGERVVPGRVHQDLWSEHLARYAFARRYASGKQVLDAGCGTGYGSAELAQAAAQVTGIDLAPAAASFAQTSYPLSNLSFAAGSCESLPFRNGAFDLIVAFEVIEHLQHYRDFLSEAARVLRPEGLFLVSTPNKSYYAESRAQTGPNPYHQHEFEAAEFYEELHNVFPNVCLLAQNRVESFAFHPSKTFWPADARIDGGGGSLEDSHFFIALCSASPLPEMRSFAYVPKAANILREREQHVQLLEKQLGQVRIERDELLDFFRKQKLELEERNRWAEQLNHELDTARSRIVDLQQEAVDLTNQYESRVHELEAEDEAKTRWAQRLTADLQQKSAELAECVRLLDQAEATVIERTQWAQRTEEKRQELEAILNTVRSSRWLRAGRQIGLGPELQEP